MSMSELGAYLQRQRADKGLSLDEVEAQTRIRRRYLEAIEAGDWDALPPGVYTRGLLKNYARVLGVNSAGVQRMYIKERPSEARLPEPRLISRPLIQTPRVSTELVLGLGLMLVALALFSWTIWTRLIPSLGPNQVSNVPTRPALTAAAGTTPKATARPTRAGPTTAPVGATVGALPSDTPATPSTPGTPPAAGATATARAGPTVAASTTPTAATAAAPAVAGGLLIEVMASSDAWVEVHTDQQKQFEGFLRSGDRKRWNARELVRLRTGNAGATEVTLNGRRLDPLGTRGAVVTREWKLLASGDIQESS